MLFWKISSKKIFLKLNPSQGSFFMPSPTAFLFPFPHNFINFKPGSPHF